MLTMLSFHQWIVFVIFVVGYLGIIFEHVIAVNKTIIALLTAVFCWIAHFLGPIPFDKDLIQFHRGLSETSAVVFFLLGALSIVESIHAHGALNLVCRCMHVRSKKGMLWVVAIVSFFLSSVMDNLTSTVVMVVLLRKLLEDRNERLIFGSVVVIAANAGGAWTPIGDVTTTMLWVGGKISTLAIAQNLFLPSLACLLASVFVSSRMISGEMPEKNGCPPPQMGDRAKEILSFGFVLLLAVPLAKCLTGLPPFLGILMALSFMWLLTDYYHKGRPEEEHLCMPAVFSSIDMVSILFFLGILLCVNVLHTAGVLTRIAYQIDVLVPAREWVAIIIGMLSSIVDNVPLVAASMGMYDAATYPMDSSFWTLIAYCAGTGGSMLIIGSAAGIAFMGLERVSFGWYLKKASIPAFIGYVSGIFIYVLQQLCG